MLSSFSPRRRSREELEQAKAEWIKAVDSGMGRRNEKKLYRKMKVRGQNGSREYSEIDSRLKGMRYVIVFSLVNAAWTTGSLAFHPVRLHKLLPKWSAERHWCTTMRVC